MKLQKNKRTIWILSAVAVVLALAIAFGVGFGVVAKKPRKSIVMDREGISLIINGGVANAAPRYTQPALQLALTVGCAGVSMTVQPTKDGAWVVMPDKNTDCIMDADKDIRTLTLRDAIELKVTKGTNAGQLQPLSLLTARDALLVCDGNRMLTVFVLPKDLTQEQTESFAAYFENYLTSATAIVCYSQEDALLLQRKCPHARIWLDGGKLEDNLQFCRDNPEIEFLLDVKKEKTAAVKEIMEQSPLNFVGKNANDPAKVKAFADLGVTAFMTDRLVAKELPAGYLEPFFPTTQPEEPLTLAPEEE